MSNVFSVLEIVPVNLDAWPIQFRGKKSRTKLMKTLSNRTLIFAVPIAAMVLIPMACLAQGPPPNQPDMSMDAKTKAEVIHTLAEKLKEQYVFPDIADKLAKMLEDRQAHGEYASITSAKEFSQLLTKQMREIAHDAHLHVSYIYRLPPMPPLPNSGQAPEPPPQMLLWLKRDNYGFDEVQRLSGNIGYLKLNGFTDAERGGDTVAGAMAFLANTDALIIDLRENHGGSPEMVDLLASYFFSGNKPVHLNDLSWRKEGTTEHDIQQWWTLPYVPGKRYVDKEVYILTSHRTPSAAEEFTYDLKVLKRAIVVGETTWGGANPGGIDRLGDHFMAFIPRGQAINPITKTNWEGTGVEPDIKVPQADALRTAHQTALQHLIEKTTDEQELNALKQALASVEAEPGQQQKR
ncbi:MAG: S41 family peptidase [Acidobacteriaceae bacterium]